MIDKKTNQIICTAHGKGRQHDFKIFKRSKIKIDENAKLIADKGYQGIDKLHPSSQIPKRKPPKKELTKEQKQTNRDISSQWADAFAQRTCIEHVIGKLKVFNILSLRYRHRRRRFGLRVNLIAALVNLSLF